MKKNFISLLTFALVLVNLVVTIIMAVAIVPSTQQANALIQKVATAIDLDLQSGDAQATGSYSIDQVEAYDFAETFTVNLKVGEDGVQHFAVVALSLSLNKGNPDFENNKTLLQNNESIIRSDVQDVISSFTYEEFSADQSAVKKALLQRMHDIFPGDFIAAVGFSSVTLQ